jgi:hypothetical protein
MPNFGGGGEFSLAFFDATPNPTSQIPQIDPGLGL